MTLAIRVFCPHHITAPTSNLLFPILENSVPGETKSFHFLSISSKTPMEAFIVILQFISNENDEIT